MNLIRFISLRLASLICAIAIIFLLFIGYGVWLYWFTEKPIKEFCESLKSGTDYSVVIDKSKTVKNSVLNQYSLDSDLVQLHSDTYLMGYICFMKFENEILEKAYWQERG
jgi:hypothetical protein